MDVQVKKDFDLSVVLDGFCSCRQGSGDLLLGPYLVAFSELCRFFKLMGVLFSFVAKDMQSKIDILEKYRCSDHQEFFKTIQSMVHHEVKNDIAKVRGSAISGSRALLGLHRALEFITGFMECIATSDDEVESSTIAANVYNKTLAKHHMWVVRKMALLAVHALPNRKELIDTMCKQDLDSAVELIKETVAAAKPVFDITQKLYEENDLLDLP